MCAHVCVCVCVCVCVLKVNIIKNVCVCVLTWQARSIICVVKWSVILFLLLRADAYKRAEALSSVRNVLQDFEKSATPSSLSGHTCMQRESKRREKWKVTKKWHTRMTQPGPRNVGKHGWMVNPVHALLKNTSYPKSQRFYPILKISLHLKMHIKTATLEIQTQVNGDWHFLPQNSNHGQRIKNTV